MATFKHHMEFVTGIDFSLHNEREVCNPYFYVDFLTLSNIEANKLFYFSVLLFSEIQLFQ